MNSEDAKENAVLQARAWAQEARTQRATVLSILRYFGLPEHDWEALELIKGKLGSPDAANAGEPKPLLAGEIAAMAHRICTEYRHVERVKYGFTEMHLLDFGWAIEKEVLARLATPTGVAADTLHAAIMNLPCVAPYGANRQYRSAYELGHRDARHAAAELVAGVAADTCPHGDQKPEPSCTNRHQCWEPCGELGKSAEHARVSGVAADESTRAPEWPAGLLDRVKAAEQRIADNHAPRRIPADVNDVDLVLAEVRRFLEGKAPPFWLDKLPSGERPSAPAPEVRPLSDFPELQAAVIKGLRDRTIQISGGAPAPEGEKR